MLLFVKKLINFYETFVWGLLQFFNFVFHLVLHVFRDYEIVQLFENLLTVVNWTEHIEHLVSDFEHELAPYEHFQANISGYVFRLRHDPVKHLPEAHLDIDSLQSCKGFVEHLPQLVHVVEFSLAIPQQVDAVRDLLDSQDAWILIEVEHSTF